MIQLMTAPHLDSFLENQKLGFISSTLAIVFNSFVPDSFLFIDLNKFYH